MTKRRAFAKLVEPVDMAPAFRYLNDEMAKIVLQAQHVSCGSHISLSSRWYCFQSQPGAEFLALAELDRQGFIAHLPMFADRLRKPSRQPGRPIQPPPILPLFPGYGFVAFDVAADQWRSVCGTRGVKRLFSFAPERPMPVPVGLVEALIRQHGPDGYIDDLKPLPKLDRIKRGSAVELLDGPFAGFPGVCQMSSERRVHLLIQGMGGAVTVETDRALVRCVA